MVIFPADREDSVAVLAVVEAALAASAEEASEVVVPAGVGRW